MAYVLRDISIQFHGEKRCLGYSQRGNDGNRYTDHRSQLPKIPEFAQKMKIGPLVNCTKVQFAQAYKSQNGHFASFGRVGVANLSVNISEGGFSYVHKMILYRHDVLPSYGSIDVVESIFNIHGNSPMYLKNDCLEFMDTDGIVWRLEFDFVEDRDAMLSEFLHFDGTIINIASNTDMTGMHIPNAIPKSVQSASASSNASDINAKMLRMLELKKLELKKLQLRKLQLEALQLERERDELERSIESQGDTEDNLQDMDDDIVYTDNSSDS